MGIYDHGAAPNDPHQDDPLAVLWWTLYILGMLVSVVILIVTLSSVAYAGRLKIEVVPCYSTVDCGGYVTQGQIIAPPRGCRPTPTITDPYRHDCSSAYPSPNYPLPAYQSYQYAQPGDVERMMAQDAAQRAEQGRQLLDMAKRAGDQRQVMQASAMIRYAANDAAVAAKAARDIAFAIAGSPYAQTALSNAQAAQSSADRAAQLARQSVTP